LLLLASTPAFADHEPVRDDIVDLRHQRWPNRRVFLGWTADDKAVIHVVSCGALDGSGSPFCDSALEVFAAEKVAHTELLGPTPDCGPCSPDAKETVWSISTELASQAIHAERAVLDALGTLQASAVGRLPTVKLAGDACRVDVLIDKRRITGALKLSAAQCMNNDGPSFFGKERIRDLQLSPDHRKLAVTFTVEERGLDSRFPIDVTMVVDAN
jgi:hypothetical protein